jgi:uncharacterized protein YndB with AHSA1/START domain
MSEHSVQHGTFTIERIYPVAPAKVYAAFATPEGKAAWFSGPADKWTPLKREFDFRVGGKEHASGKMLNGPVSHFDAIYLDIVPDARIVYAYHMHLDDRHISCSLATVEIKPEGHGTKLIFTEQAAFLDGYDDSGSRERGTKGLLDQLGAALTK